MPIPFYTIPEHLQHSIAEKLGLKSVFNFNQVSRIAYEIAKNMKRKVSFFCHRLSTNGGDKDFVIRDVNPGIEFNEQTVKEMPIRMEIRYLIIRELSEVMYNRLLNFVATTKSSVYSLQTQIITCSSEDFDNLLESVNVREFYSMSPVTLEYIRVPSIKNMDSLKVCSPMEDSDLLSQRASDICIYRANITSLGINLFLKEWMNGARVISDVIIKTLGQNLDEDIILDGIQSTFLYELYSENAYQIVNNNNDTQTVFISCNSVKLPHLIFGVYL